MPPKLILHAGTHKTGTTAIQAFAKTHAAALAARGVLYPDLTPLGIAHAYPQHRFAHALAGKDASRVGGALGPEDAARLAGLWAETAATAGATTFVSAEPLYRHALREGGGGWRAGRARYLDRLAESLAPFEVEVVLMFRRPDEHVRSLFQENLMGATRPKWPDFAAFRAHAVGGGALRYAEQAALLAERFARVRCLVYEDLPTGAGFCAAFFAALGIDASGLAPVGVVRASLDPAQTAAKLALHRRLAGPAPKAAMLRLIRSRAVAALLAKRLGPGPFGAWESPAARDAFLETMAPEVERLRAGFFPGRATLFPPADAPPPPARIDAALEEALAAAAAAAGLPDAAGAPSRPRRKPARAKARDRTRDRTETPAGPKLRRAAKAAAKAAAGTTAAAAPPAAGANGMRYRFPHWKDASWNSFERQQARYEAIRDFLGADAVGAEIGVYKGGFGEFLLGHCRKLYLVDRWYRAEGFWKTRIKDDSRVDTVIAILKTYKSEIEAGRVEVVVEAAETFLRSLEDGAMDFVYIDASHKYADTLRELHLARTKVRAGGHIFGDDYDRDPASRQHGVFRAVNDFVAATDARLVVDASRQWGVALP